MFSINTIFRITNLYTSVTPYRFTSGNYIRNRVYT